MDIQSLLGTLTNSESVSGVAQAANVSPESARSILSSALPSLLSGAVAQSQNDETAEGFAAALTQHAASDTSSISSFLSGVDLADGGKIISHLLGSNTQSAVAAAAQSSGASEEETQSVLSAAAPLLMSLLGQQTSGQQASGAGIGGIMSALMGSGDVSGLLSGLLGGATSGDKDEAASPAQSALGGILGKLFGK